MFVSRVFFSNFRKPYRVQKNPRIFPTGQAKLFKVRQRQDRNDEDVSFLKAYKPSYIMQMRSLKELCAYIHVQTSETLQESQDKIVDHEKCVELNEQWNKETQIQREKYFHKVYLDKLEKYNKHLNDDRISYEYYLTKQRESMKRDLDSLDKIITYDNINERVEAILNADIANFDFAINRNGEIVEDTRSIK